MVSLYDTNNSQRVVVKLWAQEKLLGIFSSSTTAYTPKIAITDFTGTIKPGFNASTLSGMKFNVTASKADTVTGLNGATLDYTDFMSTSSDTSTSGTVTIANNLPLLLGSNQNFEIASDVNKLGITSNYGDGKVGILTNTPEYTLDVAGSFRATTKFKLPQYTTTARDAITPEIGELIYNTTDNKVQVCTAVTPSVTWADLN